MNKDKYIGKHLSFHNTWRGKDCWEFSPFPFVSIDCTRILMGWLFFTMQISFYENNVEDYN